MDTEISRFWAKKKKKKQVWWKDTAPESKQDSVSFLPAERQRKAATTQAGLGELFSSWDEAQSSYRC